MVVPPVLITVTCVPPLPLPELPLLEPLLDPELLLLLFCPLLVLDVDLPPPLPFTGARLAESTTKRIAKRISVSKQQRNRMSSSTQSGRQGKTTKQREPTIQALWQAVGRPIEWSLNMCPVCILRSVFLARFMFPAHNPTRCVNGVDSMRYSTV